jgi:hypothetical protein
MWALWFTLHTVLFAVSLKPHAFYNLVLVAPLAALAGLGLQKLWAGYRDGGPERWLLPAEIAASGAWAAYLAGKFAYAPWLPLAVAVTAGVATLLTMVPAWTIQRPAIALAAVALLLAPVTWTVSVMDNKTVVDAHRPSAGPPALPDFQKPLYTLYDCK